MHHSRHQAGAIISLNFVPKCAIFSLRIFQISDFRSDHKRQIICIPHEYTTGGGRYKNEHAACIHRH